jgi:hypothetical protein
VIEWPVDSSVNWDIGLTNVASLLTVGIWGLETAYVLEYQNGNYWTRVGKNKIPTVGGFPTGAGKHYFVDKNLSQGLHRLQVIC